MMPIREPMDGASASTPSTYHYPADSQRPHIQSTVLHTLSHQSSTYHHPFNMTATETASAVSRSVKQVGRAFYNTAMSYVSGWSANSEQPEKGSEIDQCMYILQSAIVESEIADTQRLWALISKRSLLQASKMTMPKTSRVQDQGSVKLSYVSPPRQWLEWYLCFCCPQQR